MAQVRIIRADTSRESICGVIRKMQRQCLGGDKPLDPRRGYWWLATVDGVIAGFASLDKSRRWADAGYLSRSGVLPQFRGHGIQKLLIRARERKARQLGWNWLISDTRQNPASANSLIACGYRVYLPSSPWAFMDTTYWRRRIKP